MSTKLTMAFEHSYQKLSSSFYQPATPKRPSRPRLIAFNHKLALELALETDALDSQFLAETFSGHTLPANAWPIALAYAGHQFGHFVPQLGDGRAILLGELRGKNNQLLEIQLKGAGPTAFSRSGDGLSALGPVLREYLVSEAMHQLKIPTTRALCAVMTGDTVYREEALPGAVFTRVATSHLRVGTFQYFTARGDYANLKLLADFAIGRHYPECAGDYLAFFDAVVSRHQSLVAQWMGVGFIHGVMNTDNTSISGETLDYGPCAFMDEFHWLKKFSYIDRHGRYAFGNQANILQWNMARLAECLLPLFSGDSKLIEEKLNQRINAISHAFNLKFLEQFGAKLGLSSVPQTDPRLASVINLWLNYLQEEQLDFTISFNQLGQLLKNPNATLFKATETFNQFHSLWRQLVEDPLKSIKQMAQQNPVYIPRNHLIEEAIAESLRDNFDPFHRLLDLVQKPYEEQDDFPILEQAPKIQQRVKATFCGT